MRARIRSAATSRDPLASVGSALASSSPPLPSVGLGAGLDGNQRRGPPEEAMTLRTLSESLTTSAAASVGERVSRGLRFFVGLGRQGLLLRPKLVCMHVRTCSLHPRSLSNPKHSTTRQQSSSLARKGHQSAPRPPPQETSFYISEALSTEDEWGLVIRPQSSGDLGGPSQCSGGAGDPGGGEGDDGGDAEGLAEHYTPSRSAGTAGGGGGATARAGVGAEAGASGRGPRQQGSTGAGGASSTSSGAARRAQSGARATAGVQWLDLQQQPPAQHAADGPRSMQHAHAARQQQHAAAAAAVVPGGAGDLRQHAHAHAHAQAYAAASDDDEDLRHDLHPSQGNALMPEEWSALGRMRRSGGVHGFSTTASGSFAGPAGAAAAHAHGQQQHAAVSAPCNTAISPGSSRSPKQRSRSGTRQHREQQQEQEQHQQQQQRREQHEQQQDPALPSQSLVAGACSIQIIPLYGAATAYPAFAAPPRAELTAEERVAQGLDRITRAAARQPPVVVSGQVVSGQLSLPVLQEALIASGQLHEQQQWLDASNMHHEL